MLISSQLSFVSETANVLREREEEKNSLIVFDVIYAEK